MKKPRHTSSVEFGITSQKTDTSNRTCVQHTLCSVATAAPCPSVDTAWHCPPLPCVLHSWKSCTLQGTTRESPSHAISSSLLLFPRVKLIKQRIMKTYGEWRYSSTILDLGTRWMWLVRRLNRVKLLQVLVSIVSLGSEFRGIHEHTLRVVSFMPRPLNPGTHCWVGPRVGLDAVKKRIIIFLCRESNSNYSAL
jgi:hypothetical protein